MPLSMDRWKGQVALVTGASSGIGAAIAVALVGEGMQVVGAARRVERVQELAKQLEGKPGSLHAVKCDVTKEEEILDAFKWTKENVGPVSVLINNAGLLQMTSLTDGETEKWKTVFDTNVMGLCIATREAVRMMKENGIDGHVIHIGSAAGHVVPQNPIFNVYPASKFAVTALTESLRVELGAQGSGIKVSCICPGFVKTEIVEKNLNEEIAKVVDSFPSLNSEDIADSVIYCLSTPPHVQVHDIIIIPQKQPVNF